MYYIDIDGELIYKPLKGSTILVNGLFCRWKKKDELEIKIIPFCV